MPDQVKKPEDRFSHNEAHIFCRLLNTRLDKAAVGDYETGDGAMKLLEHRIQAFHIKYGEGHKTKNLPHLRRYKLDVSKTKRMYMSFIAKALSENRSGSDPSQLLS